MSMTERLLEMHETRAELRRMVEQREEEDPTTRIPRLTAADKNNVLDLMVRMRCHQFRQEMNLDRDQLLVNGSGDLAELLDVSKDYVRLGILDTGQAIYVPRKFFRPVPKR